jgi:hypothetical protein
VASKSDGTVTTINASYLRSLVSTFLQPLLDDVNKLLQNGQVETLPGSSTSVEVPRLDSTLTVPAGSSNFKPAADLINALGAVGSSINSDLNWFQQALTETIDEISTTVASMKKTDDLNAEQVQTLEQDFAGAIAAVTSSPTGGTGGGGSPAPSPGGSGGSGGVNGNTGNNPNTGNNGKSG